MKKISYSEKAAALLLALFLLLSSLAGCGPSVDPGAESGSPDASAPESTDGTSAPAEQTDAPTTQAPESGTSAPETEAPSGPDGQERDISRWNPTADQTIIVYDFNGGTAGSAFAEKSLVVDSATKKINVRLADGCMVQTVTGSEYLCPHALGDKGYLARAGYVLTGYNTKADGSGDYYACGWNVPIVKGQKILLYAQWAAETPRSQFKIEGTTVLKYSGADETVVIPNGITEIAGAAFVSNPSVRTVIMPKSVQTLNSRSFHNCANLTTVCQYDLITQMPADTFSGCEALTRFFIGNANDIRYLGGNKQGSYMQKFQRMLLYKNEKKIILIGGSNLCYGLDSATLKKNLGNEYEIVNYGTMYWCPSTFFVDLAAAFVGEGDIILTAPEEEPWQWGKVWTGAGVMNYASYLMYFCEGCMEAFSYVDMSLYRNLLPSIAEANAARMGGGKSYESVWSESVNEYGDFDYDRTAQSARKKTTLGKNGATIPSGWANTSYADWYGEAKRAEYFTKENTDNLNRAFDACIQKGARVFISFSVSDKMYIADDSDATLAAYESDIEKCFVKDHPGVYLISHVKDYLYEDADFYNSMHHLLWEPACRRTATLYADISAQLQKLK